VLISERRQLHLKKACARLQNKIPELKLKPDKDRIFVDDARRYIYCLVSKASCTSWMRALIGISDNEALKKELNGSKELERHFVHVLSGKVFKRLSTFSPSKIRFRWKNFYKFMFVREPLERLVSAYRDKMFRDPHYRKEVIPSILAKYRNTEQTAASEYRVVSDLCLNIVVL
jgi:Sulfotransferase family